MKRIIIGVCLVSLVGYVLVTWLNLPNVTTTSTIHSNVINDTDFSYRVYSVNAIGTSLVSNTAVVWSLPNVPTNLDVSPYWQQINVTWTVVDAVYTYDLEHSTDGNTWCRKVGHPRRIS